jgi:uncharacterized YigZ family protein
MLDTYKTISTPAQGYFKDKGSKFYTYLYPVTDEEQLKELIKELRREHHSARHHCFAWRLGQEETRERANDDGEPSSTAGKPILGQLVSHELTDVLCIVVRYFGGTLLGVSGLIHAYRTATANAIQNANIEIRIMETTFNLVFSYNELNSVMQILKNENLEQTSIELVENCRITFRVRKAEAGRIENIFKNLYGVEITHEKQKN